VVSDKRLDSLSVSIVGCCPQLTFRHNFNLEASEIDPDVGSMVACSSSAQTVAIRSKTFLLTAAAL
jgi:hypothetical protein